MSEGFMTFPDEVRGILIKHDAFLKRKMGGIKADFRFKDLGGQLNSFSRQWLGKNS